MRNYLKRLCWAMTIGMLFLKQSDASTKQQTQIANYHFANMTDEEEQFNSTTEGEYVVFKINETFQVKFPLDGHQPTTKDAVELSCANGRDQAITNWYLKMFGVIDKNGENSDKGDNYVKAGYDASGKNTTIIEYNFCDISKYCERSLTQKLCKFHFIGEFKKIASTSVGRMLLYRLLIEIRRVNESNNGCEESHPEVKWPIRLPDIWAPILHQDDRNKYRSLVVCPHSRFELFLNHKESNKLYLRAVFSAQSSIYVFGKTEKDWIHFYEDDTFSVDIFHEMVHWFYCLRFFKRAKRENSFFSDGLTIQNHPLGIWYYLDGNPLKKFEEISDAKRELWNNEPRNQKINFNDFRTIMGLQLENYDKETQDKYDFLNGDDLCENLYRDCIGMPMRYSYTTKPNVYMEDTKTFAKFCKFPNYYQKQS